MSVTYFILGAVGFVTLNVFTYRILSFAAFYFLPSTIGLEKYKGRSESWALITGSSGGIGLGYAQELVSGGFGVILLAHKADEVDAAEAKLKAEFSSAKVKKIVLDASSASAEDVEQALRPYLDLHITILINNVGVAAAKKPFLKPLTEFSAQDVDSCINVNARFSSQITRILLPTLSKNGPSLVLSMSSAALTGFAYLTVYSATKCYGHSFSVAVARECKAFKNNVDVVAILPGDVHSDGNVVGVAPGSPTARQFAYMAFNRVGRAVSWGKKEFIPYWKHALQIMVFDYLPTNIADTALEETIGTKMKLVAKHDQLLKEGKKE